MGHKKLIRFEAIKSFPNVLQFPQNMRGKWNEFFRNPGEITVELACGKGEYTVALAQKYPQRNFIGVDIKGNRLWAGAKKCIDNQVHNAAFLRTQIEQINDYFAPGEINEIWITFPDPQLRLSKARKRLTHPRFLRLYRQMLAPGSYIHLKTDSPDLYNFTKLVCRVFELPLEEDEDNLYAREDLQDELKIKTYYERMNISGSNRVHYLKFSLPEELPFEKDEQLKQLLKEEEPKAS